MATEMLMKSYTRKEIYDLKRKIAESQSTETLEAYMRGTQCFGKTIARILCFLEPGMKACYDVLEERLNKKPKENGIK